MHSDEIKDDDSWRPISNLDERDPQLILHTVHGKFDGTITPECWRTETSSSNSIWAMDTHRRGKPRRDLHRKSTPSLWSKLSLDVIFFMLLRLPYKSQFRFHAVCKQWRDYLSSSKVAEETATLKIFARSPQVICAYEYLGPNRSEPNYAEQDFIEEGAIELAENLRSAITKLEGRKVHRMDLSFAPSWIIGNRITASRDGILLSSARTTGRCFGPPSAHGGMCLLNPFTRTWRELPPVPSKSSELLWADDVIVEKKSPSHYKAIVLMGTGDGNEWSVYQFSSKTNEWRMAIGDFPKEYSLNPVSRKFKYMSHAYVFTEDLLYLWRGNVTGDLLIHRLNDGTLVSEYAVGYPKSYLNCFDWRFMKVHLVEYHGEIYGGWLLSSWRPQPGCMFAISKLNLIDMKWEELGVVPLKNLEWMLEERIKDYRPQEWRYFEHKAVVVVGDYICINITSDHGITGVNVQYVGGYHIPSKSWVSFDFHEPFVPANREFELFEPNCLQVFL